MAIKTERKKKRGRWRWRLLSRVYLPVALTGCLAEVSFSRLTTDPPCQSASRCVYQCRILSYGKRRQIEREPPARRRRKRHLSFALFPYIRSDIFSLNNDVKETISRRSLCRKLLVGV